MWLSVIHVGDLCKKRATPLPAGATATALRYFLPTREKYSPGPACVAARAGTLYAVFAPPRRCAVLRSCGCDVGILGLCCGQRADNLPVCMRTQCSPSKIRCAIPGPIRVLA